MKKRRKGLLALSFVFLPSDLLVHNLYIFNRL